MPVTPLELLRARSRPTSAWVDLKKEAGVNGKNGGPFDGRGGGICSKKLGLLSSYVQGF